MATEDQMMALLQTSRPCPFAAVGDQDKHQLQIIGEPELGTMYLACACGARSPFARHPVEVVRRWNTRYADTQLADVQGLAGRVAIGFQQRVDEAEAKFSAMQVENNKLLERAQTAEATAKLAADFAQMAAATVGDDGGILPILKGGDHG